MISIIFITFRESLEMLLVFGVLLTELQKTAANKKRDLYLGSGLGLLLSIILFILVSLVGSKIHFNIDKNASELFEGLNYLGSGIFLFITAILLHKKMRLLSSGLSSLLLDTSIFAVGFLSILREGMEIIVFSISSTILSPFLLSFLGLIIGLALTVGIGLVSSTFLQSRISHKKLLLVADWGIKLLALYFVVRGVMGLSEFIF